MDLLFRLGNTLQVVDPRRLTVQREVKSSSGARILAITFVDSRKMLVTTTLDMRVEMYVRRWQRSAIVAVAVVTAASAL